MNPGSKEAQKLGCRCPVMDNEEMPEGRWWISADCPIHGRKDAHLCSICRRHHGMEIIHACE
jgi:hypothetical protein